MGAAATTTGKRNIYEPANADVYLYKADDAAHMSERAAAQLELAIARGDDGAVKDALANLARAATAAASTEGPAHRDGSSDSFKSPTKASLAEKKKHYSAHKRKQLERQATIEQDVLDGHMNGSVGQGGLSLLMQAVRRDSPAIVKQLLAAGAAVNATDHTGGNSCAWAAIGNRSDAVLSALIDAGADVNATDVHGRSPLMLVAQRGRWIAGTNAIVSKLLDAGAEVNAEDSQGRTALGLASEAGSEKCVERLGKAGARYGRGDHASKRCKAKGFLSKHRAPSLRHPRDFEWEQG